jgi:uncharacterized repeat protein (TIGR01451 family)
MSRHPGSGPRDGRARSAAARAWCAAVAAAWAFACLAPAPAWAVADDIRAPAPKSDMQITAVASAGFTSGANATYTLTVDNNGPQAAGGPHTVTNTLPAGLTFISAVGTGSWICADAGQVVTCTWAGAYSKNVPTTITIVAFITSSVATSVTNVATVADNGDDTNLANNTASTTSAVTVRRVATTPDAATTSQLPSNGVNYTQTFVVANTGNVSDSYNLVATVAPAGVVTVVSVAGTAGSSATTVPAIAAGGTRNVAVVYSVSTGAATGASATITLTATSTVAGTSTDAGDLTVTVARAGVTMTKALYRDDRTTLVTGPSAVSVGEYVQYRVTITNGGSAPANILGISDPIPGAVTYDSATPDAAGWTIAIASGTLTANLAGTLAAGASRFFWIRVRVK